MKRIILIVIVVVAVAGLAAVAFVPRGDSTDGAKATSEGNVLWRDELFDYAIDTILNRLEDYHSAEMRQETLARLDQWVRKQKPIPGWEPDPVIAGASEDLQSAAEKMLKMADQFARLQQGQSVSVENVPADLGTAGEQLGKVSVRLGMFDMLPLASQMVSAASDLKQQIDRDGLSPERAVRNLISRLSVEAFALQGAELHEFARRIDPDVLAFRADDPFAFQEPVWLRNVASWACGDELDDPVKPAVALFDWVVKNVQLMEEPKGAGDNGPTRVLQHPWETMLFGQGTAIDRAWLFVLLARQRNLDAALLGFAGGEEGSAARLWAVGVLIDGEIYLFEPVLGVPIPRSDGVELGENGLVIQPATLSEAISDDSVLRGLDLLNEGDYAVDAEDLKNIVALIEAGPTYLTQRMKMVESRLSGDENVVLTTDATAQIERFRNCEGVADARMWTLPYRTLWQQIHFRAQREIWWEAMMRPFGMGTAPLLWKARNYYFKGQFTGSPSATEFYQAARQSEFALATSGMDDKLKEVWKEMKLDASYWLGLMVAETGNYRAAEDYLMTRVLRAVPGSKWEYGAAYNLARVYEATGDIPKAVAFYQSSLSSPCTRGNLTRAGWLKELSGMADPQPTPTTPEAETEKDAEAPPEAPDEKPDEVEETPSEAGQADAAPPSDDEAKTETAKPDETPDETTQPGAAPEGASEAPQEDAPSPTPDQPESTAGKNDQEPPAE